MSPADKKAGMVRAKRRARLRCGDISSPPQNLCEEYRTLIKCFRTAAEFSFLAIKWHWWQWSKTSRNTVKRTERFGYSSETVKIDSYQIHSAPPFFIKEYRICFTWLWKSGYIAGYKIYLSLTFSITNFQTRNFALPRAREGRGVNKCSLSGFKERPEGLAALSCHRFSLFAHNPRGHNRE